jgi:hypothetical protein
MPEHASHFSDTDPRVNDTWVKILRQKTPGERMEIALGLTGLALRVAESGVRERYPNASEREIFLRSAALRLPRDLMIQAYGWDPEIDSALDSQ